MLVRAGFGAQPGAPTRVLKTFAGGATSWQKTAYRYQATKTVGRSAAAARGPGVDAAVQAKDVLCCATLVGTLILLRPARAAPIHRMLWSLALSLASMFLLGGCLNAYNAALPKNFIADPENRAAIDTWRSKVQKDLKCHDGANERAADADNALCEVARTIKTRQPTAAILATADNLDCAGSVPCLSDEYREEWAVFYPETQNAERVRPYLGVALSGGGPRSAFFSIGALKALYETGTLQRANYLSSVSGGGYAAYWYFSQLMDEISWEDSKSTPFSDCVHTEVTDWLKGRNRLPPGVEGCSGHGDFQSQSYLADHTDLLTSGDGSFQDHLGEYAFDLYPATGSLAYTFPFTRSFVWLPAFAVTALPHHLANTVFDWSWNGSLYGWWYRSGIHRAFGPPPRCKDQPPGSSCRSSQPNCNAGFNKLGKPTDAANCLSFQHNGGSLPGDLRAATCGYWKQSAERRNRPFPIWIINTMGVPANSVFHACMPDTWKAERTLAANKYEITPFGYGSGLFGFFSRTDRIDKGQKGPGPLLLLPGDIEPHAAVHASGAAVTSAGLTSIEFECLFRVFEQLSNFSLGVRLTNPVFEGGDRVLHRTLIWPLYYLHGYSSTPQNPEILLSDGGHIDNLGLYSLVRRGVRNILMFDASEDKKGQFQDLVRTSALLEKEGIGVRLNDLCQKGGKSPCANPESYKFKICRENKCANPDRAAFDPRNAPQQVFVGEYYLIGAETAKNRTIGKIVYVKSSLPAGWNKDSAECEIEPTGDQRLPCTTYVLLKEGGKREADFPNKSTIEITLDSKATVFRALRDLGYSLGVQAIRSLR